MSRPPDTLKPETAEEAVDRLIRESGDSPDADLIREIMMTALKMSRDGTPRGDLKILNAALKELRYAFKVFSPYRLTRKVSVFGSARTPAGSPEYDQARRFAAQMAGEGFMVITGAGPGIMEAANEGAGKDMGFGVNILLPFEQNANPVMEGDDKLVHMRDRKSVV